MFDSPLVTRNSSQTTPSTIRRQSQEVEVEQGSEASEAYRLPSAALETSSARSREATDAGTHTHTHKEAIEAERLMSAAVGTWAARSREPTDAGTHTHTQRGR